MAGAHPPFQAKLLTQKVPVILGPTGIGKSELAYRLALALDGEVVVADSRQVYRDLDIATNKPSPQHQERVRYHMIDVVDPSVTFNAAHYVRGANAAIASIHDRGRSAIVEGGTMLYVDALCDGFTLTGIPPNPELRARLASLEPAVLEQRLLALDADAGVDLRNPARTIRAIEILEAAGPPLKRLRTRQAPDWKPIRIGLTADLKTIDERLAARSLEQVARGLVAETQGALDRGVPANAPVMMGIGYAEALRYIRGEITLDELPEVMARSNRRYARRQLRWWRRNPAVTWFAIEPDPLPAILSHIKESAA